MVIFCKPWFGFARPWLSEHNLLELLARRKAPLCLTVYNGVKLIIKKHSYIHTQPGFSTRYFKTIETHAKMQVYKCNKLWQFSAQFWS